MLIGALAIDTLFTVLIFATDGWISHIQRGEIIALETRLADRSVSDPQLLAISDALKKFRDTPVDVFVSGTSSDTGPLANRVVTALTNAGWKPLAWLWSGPLIIGILVTPKGGSSPAITEAADTLAKSFADVGLKTEKTEWSAANWGNFGGFLTPLFDAARAQSFDAARAQLRIIVGTKP